MCMGFQQDGYGLYLSSAELAGLSSLQAEVKAKQYWCPVKCFIPILQKWKLKNKEVRKLLQSWRVRTPPSWNSKPACLFNVLSLSYGAVHVF